MGGTDDNYPIAVCHFWSKMGQNWENRLKDFLLTGKKMGCSIWPLQSNHIKQQYLKLSKLVRQVWIKYPQTIRLKFSNGSGSDRSEKSILILVLHGFCWSDHVWSVDFWFGCNTFWWPVYTEQIVIGTGSKCSIDNIKCNLFSEIWLDSKSKCPK